MNSLDIALVMGVTLAMVPFTGVLLALTPYLMRRGEVFAVTVPSAAQHDPTIKNMKRQYAGIIMVVTVLLSAVGLWCAASGNEAGVIVVLVVGMLALCAGSYALMLYYRAKTKAYKREQGWQAKAQETVAVIGESTDEVPRAIPLSWNLLYIPVVLLTLVIGVVGYPYLPDMVPMQSDFAGNVGRWEPKGPGIVLFPVAVQVFMAVCFVFSHWMIMRSKKWTEPGAPATSAVAYGLFARAQSIFLLVIGVFLTLAIGVVFELSSLMIISMGQAAAALMSVVFLVLVGSIAMSVVYGQAGSRVFKHMQASDKLLSDEDEHWKLGIFYYNPEDASLFLPERFGIGWTVNWARPAVWGITVAGVVVTVGFVVLVMVLV